MNNPETIEDPRKLEIEELYQHMYKQYKASRFEIGQMQSDIDELKYERDQLKSLLEKLKAADQDTIKQVRREQMYVQIKKHNDHLEKRIARLREDNTFLITKLNTNGTKKQSGENKGIT